jgi:uncharacterized membrane protein YqjE
MGNRPPPPGGLRAEGAVWEEAPLSQLIRDLAADGRRLVRGEVDLAKLELRQTARAAATDGLLVGAGGLVIAFGVACLMAALVIGVGVVVGSYWLSALLVGLLLLVAGGLTLMTGVRRLRSARLSPERSIESLRDDVEWLGDEVRTMRRDWSGT